jgi:endonuclease/exonuclease/phosphatase family metal-dependent hydrolase
MWMRSLFLAACGLCAVTSLAADDDGQTDTLRVITYNIRYANPGDGPDVWANRVDAVAGVVARGDIVGLQEVTHGQLVDLQQRLGGFAHCGVGRDDGKQRGEYSPIFYRQDRFESIDEGTFWLSESPGEVGSTGWDAALPRICSWVFLRDRRSDARFWIANTHFDHIGQSARLQSGKLLLEMAGKRGNRQPLIVVGDFNCLRQSEPYLAIVAAGSSTRLLDARDRTDPQGPHSTWNGFREIEPDRIIDHVFTTESIVVESLETLDPKTSAGRFASDHLPVTVDVRVTAESSP